MAGFERKGTQSIERALVLLRELAARSTFGWRLTDLAAQCELDRGTVHRILNCLIRERLVQHRESDRHYLLGPLLLELSLALPPLGEFQAACRVSLSRIARRTGGVAFLYLRSGPDFVCAARVGGTTLKALSINVGTRRPLATSAGGVAILMALPEQEALSIIDDNIKHVKRYGELRIQSLQKMIQRSKSHGFGINLGDVVPGVNSVAVAIADLRGAPFASVAVSGAAEEFPRAGAAEVVSILNEEGRCILREALRTLPGALIN